MLIRFYSVAKDSKFPADKWRFDKTLLHCSVALSKSNEFLLIYGIANKRQFPCQESIIIDGISAYERVYTKEKSNFHFQKCPRPLTRVSAYGNI